ncbi:MAG: hypothetical protein ACRD6R_08105 [Candidatus Polarisedimenticolia bacterium]
MRGPAGAVGRLVAGAGLAGWALALARQDRPFSPLDWANLAFHEAGHLVFAPFGRTLHLLGGTLLQLLVPMVLTGYFLLRRHSPPAALACAFWIGESLLNVYVYMADARDLSLPLVGGGEHDWNGLLYDFGLLNADAVAAISGWTRGAAVLLMLGAAGALAWLALRPDHEVALRESLEERAG